MFFEWGKKKNLKDQSEMQIVLARQNVDTMMETVELEARKAFQAYEQAKEELEIAHEVFAARQDAAADAKTPVEVMTAQSAAAKSGLELMQAELNYRLSHAKLNAAIGRSSKTNDSEGKFRKAGS